MTDFVTPDVRDGIPLPSRPAERPMPLSVRYGCPSVAAYPSLLTAGADEAEADAAQRIAADPSVIDAERDPLYGDGVQHCGSLAGQESDGLARIVRRAAEAEDSGGLSECCDEETRLGRLSRWQEQR